MPPSWWRLTTSSGSILRPDSCWRSPGAACETSQSASSLAKRAGERAAADLVDERVRRLDVPALSLGAVHRLLRDRTGLVLPRPALRRVHEVAAGNAFYALELGRALARLGAPLAAGEPLPVPGELRELVRDRIVALPAGTGECARGGRGGLATDTAAPGAGGVRRRRVAAGARGARARGGHRGAAFRPPPARVGGVPGAGRGRAARAAPPARRHGRGRRGAGASPRAHRGRPGRGDRGRARGRLGPCPQPGRLCGGRGALRPGMPADAGRRRGRPPPADDRHRAAPFRRRRPGPVDRAARAGARGGDPGERPGGGARRALEDPPLPGGPASGGRGRAPGPDRGRRRRSGARRGRAGPCLDPLLLAGRSAGGGRLRGVRGTRRRPVRCAGAARRVALPPRPARVPRRSHRRTGDPPARRRGRRRRRVAARPRHAGLQLGGLPPLDGGPRRGDAASCLLRGCQPPW